MVIPQTQLAHRIQIRFGVLILGVPDGSNDDGNLQARTLGGRDSPWKIARDILGEDVASATHGPADGGPPCLRRRVGRFVVISPLQRN